MQNKFSNSPRRRGTYLSRSKVFGFSVLAAMAMLVTPALSAGSIAAESGGQAMAEQESSAPKARRSHARRGGMPILGRISRHFHQQRSVEDAPPEPMVAPDTAAEDAGEDAVSELVVHADDAPVRGCNCHRVRHKRIYHSRHHHFHGIYSYADQFAVPLGNRGYSAPAYRGHGRVTTTIYTAPWEAHVDGGSVVGPRPGGSYERTGGQRVIVLPPIVRRVPHRHFHKHW